MIHKVNLRVNKKLKTTQIAKDLVRDGQNVNCEQETTNNLGTSFLLFT